jgi:hypothetical protein
MTCTDFLAAINARLFDSSDPVVMSDTLIISFGGGASIHADIVNLGGEAQLRVCYDTHSRSFNPYTRPVRQSDIDGYVGIVWPPSPPASRSTHRRGAGLLPGALPTMSKPGRKPYENAAEALRRLTLAADWGGFSGGTASALLIEAGLEVGRTSAQTMLAEVAGTRPPMPMRGVKADAVAATIVRCGEVPDYAPPLSLRALLAALAEQGHAEGLEVSVRWHLGV